MRSEDGLVLVALDQGRVVGFALAEIRGPHKVYRLERYGALDTVAVAADYRRRGVGEAMLREILNWLRSKNVGRVELEVLSGNDVGYGFWRKLGFKDYRHRLFLKL
jgi:ribosomal protein S18 acetylase RimI-like enzyme